MYLMISLGVQACPSTTTTDVQVRPLSYTCFSQTCGEDSGYFTLSTFAQTDPTITIGDNHVRTVAIQTLRKVLINKSCGGYKEITSYSTVSKGSQTIFVSTAAFHKANKKHSLNTISVSSTSMSGIGRQLEKDKTESGNLPSPDAKRQVNKEEKKLDATPRYLADKQCKSILKGKRLQYIMCVELVRLM